MLEKGLADLLAADATIASMASNRVRHIVLPEGTDYPAIVITQVASQYIVSQQGVNALQMARYQVDAYTRNQKTVRQLRQAIHNVLDGYRGTLSDGTKVHSILPNSDVEFWSDDDDKRLFRVAADFNIWFINSGTI